MLVLYVFKCDNPKLHDPERAKASFGDVVHFSRILEDRRLDLVTDHPAPWYGYIFSDEYLDDDAKKALPVFLASDQFDCLILMKKIIVDGKMKVTQAPRIFRKDVKLMENTHIPENAQRLRFERMLDGWVLDDTSQT